VEVEARVLIGRADADADRLVDRALGAALERDPPGPELVAAFGLGLELVEEARLESAAKARGGRRRVGQQDLRARGARRENAAREGKDRPDGEAPGARRIPIVHATPRCNVCRLVWAARAPREPEPGPAA
jgi:hypothetical protein